MTRNMGIKETSCPSSKTIVHYFPCWK